MDRVKLPKQGAENPRHWPIDLSEQDEGQGQEHTEEYVNPGQAGLNPERRQRDSLDEEAQGDKPL